MMVKYFRPLGLFSIFLFTLLLSGCFHNDDNSNLERGELLGYSLLSSNSAESINLVLQLMGVGGSFSAAYQVDSYRITYRTVDVAGEFIVASGLLSVPKKLAEQSSPLVSYQHGTIFEHSSAPSNSAVASDKEVLIASLGFVVSSPDYLGFGASSNILHPYLHGDTLASATVDMARAAKLFLQQQSISMSDELFLMGYSEGGYATLATHKEIQQAHSDEFQVTASFPGAGPYDLSYTAQELLSDTLVYPAYVGFMFKAYDDIYQLSRLDELFKPPYADVVDSSFDGSKGGSEINNLLTDDPTALIQAGVLADFLGEGEQDFKALLDGNSLVAGWLPESPVFFYHGEQDMIVPFGNAGLALQSMAGTGIVSLTRCSGVAVTNHTECATPFALYSLGVMMGMTGNL